MVGERRHTHPVETEYPAMKTPSLPRVPLAHLPTPVEPMPRLSSHLAGPKLWVKRDDQTGLAFGGNKTRKLEFLLAEAQAHGARTLLTRGAVQSNHCRQTAAAAARLGLDCILVLGGERPPEITGNALIDQLLGAEMRWAGEADPETLLEETFQQAWADGRRPYRIPYGGSSPVGAAAYAAAMAEFMKQDIEVDRIVLATSSGGTQAGLLAGARLHGFRGSILGISVDKPAAELKPVITELTNQVLGLLGSSDRVEEEEVLVSDAYLGGGYAVVGELEREAVYAFARTEGLLLDPVYTGRAAGGLMDLIARGEIGPEERVLFWHTGGTPALFAFARDLAEGP